MTHSLNSFSRLLCILLFFISPLVLGKPSPDSSDIFIDGELMIVHIDYMPGQGKSKFVYHIKERGTGKIVELEFEHKLPQNLRTGDKINIRGKQNSKKIWVLDIAGSQDEESDSVEQPPASEPQVEGAATEYRALYMLVNMVDTSGAPLHTFSESNRVAAEGVMFNNTYSVDSVNQESSFGNVAFPGSVGKVIIVTIEKPDNCPYYTIANLADSAANTSFGGTDSSSNYNRKIYLVPPSSVSDCSWLALGQVGSYGSTATRLSWTTTNNANAIIHEEGHNHGWHHAATDPNNDEIMDVEYGDTSGAMDYCCSQRKFNSVHLHQIGWLPAADVVTVTSGGTYQISPLGDAGAANPQLLLIEKDSSILSYYLSYRQVKNLDLSLNSTYTRGVNIHNGRLNNNWSYFVQSLSDGGVFEDIVNGIYINQISRDNTSVLLNISITGPQPPSDPTDLAATATSETTIDLAWNDNAVVETGYSVERSDDGVNDWLEVAQLSADATSHTDGGLSPSTTYYYRVIANNGSTPSDNYSNIDNVTTDDPPPFVNQYAVSDNFVSGTVSGDYTDTWGYLGNVESVRERESGGRPANRYSYLEHGWSISVTPGNAVTLFLNAWSSGSTDGDEFEFEYSINGGSYQPIATISNISDTGHVSVPLPNTTNGTVYIRVTDTNRDSGNKALDYIFVNQLYIRIDNQSGGTPPAKPTILNATAISASQVDFTWSDVDGEYGYEIERSTNTGPWELIDTVGPDLDAYQDTSVSELTNYDYMVRAYNGSGSSPNSDVANVTTPEGPNDVITLIATGEKQKGVQHAILEWTGISTGTVNI